MPQAANAAHKRALPPALGRRAQFIDQIPISELLQVHVALTAPAFLAGQQDAEGRSVIALACAS